MQAFKCSFMFDGAFIRDYSAERRNIRKAKQMENVTREQWLRDFVEYGFADKFAAIGAPLPENINVSCGFPSSRGLSANRRTLGQIFDPSCSADGTTEIFISPTLDCPERVAATLCHELVHAAVGVKQGHGPEFRKVALAMGLQGKMTATVAGPGFQEMFDHFSRSKGIMSVVGEYPHSKLDATQRKKQRTRMVKCQCHCGYTVRTTRTWIAVGVPHCPLHGEMTVAS